MLTYLAEVAVPNCYLTKQGKCDQFLRKLQWSKVVVYLTKQMGDGFSMRHSISEITKTGNLEYGFWFQNGNRFVTTCGAHSMHYKAYDLNNQFFLRYKHIPKQFRVRSSNYIFKLETESQRERVRDREIQINRERKLYRSAFKI